MTRLISLLLLIEISHFCYAQDQPNETDTKAYSEAYELIYDTESRARKAEQLLLRNGDLSFTELNPRELSLLCKVYNELFEFDKQFEVAKLLWKLEPNSIDGIKWIDNSYRIRFREQGGPEETLKFVEDHLSEGIGNRRFLLILKARALISKNIDALLTASRDEDRTNHAGRIREIVSELLIQASSEPFPAMKPFPNKESLLLEELSPELLVKRDRVFSKVFNANEREAIERACISTDH